MDRPGPDPIDQGTVLVRAPWRHEAEVGDRLVVLDTRRHLVHVLDEHARMVWSMFGAPTTTAEVRRALASDRHDAAPVLEFIGQLCEQHLLVDRTSLDVPDVPDVLDVPDGPAAAMHDAPTALVPAGARPASTGPRRLRVAGATFAVSVDDDLREHFDAWCAHHPEVADEPDVRIDLMVVEYEGSVRDELWIDGRLRAASEDRRSFTTRAEREFNLTAIESTPASTRLHAGAVERDGRVVLLVGASGRGKSTLTARLVRRGFRYLSDELAAVTATGEVLPYAKPLSLDRHARHDLDIGSTNADDGTATDTEVASAKANIDPGSLGDVAAGGRLALVVMLDPLTGATSDDRPDDRPVDPPTTLLDPLDALLELVPNAFAATWSDDDALETLARTCSAVPVVRLSRRSPDEDVTAIEALIAELG